ncbi:hypothetical protein ABIB38_004593 [Massilia sp. UYP11]|uniref:hypothetical protein n=1 Tax=Massilia sp. UYP11 TaxID=1756385 RepID=UPI003D23C7C5
MIVEREARVDGIERLQWFDAPSRSCNFHAESWRAVSVFMPAWRGPLKTQNITAVNDSRNRLQQHHLTFTVFQIAMRRCPVRAPMVKAVSAIPIAVVEMSNLAHEESGNSAHSKSGKHGGELYQAAVSPGGQFGRQEHADVLFCRQGAFTNLNRKGVGVGARVHDSTWSMHITP